jgi:hypothetical protein
MSAAACPAVHQHARTDEIGDGSLRTHEQQATAALLKHRPALISSGRVIA